MPQRKFKLGDVVEYKRLYEGDVLLCALGIVVAHDGADYVYLNWISAPKVDSLWWHHEEGEFIADVSHCTLVTHIDEETV
jgi:hypothetical protein